MPVENLDVLSRYGHADQDATLDKLGGVGWQSRKAKVKERIRELAGELIKVAAERAMRQGTVLDLPHGRPRLERIFELWLDWSELERAAGGCLIMAASIELDDQPGPLLSPWPVPLPATWVEHVHAAQTEAERFKSDDFPC